MSASARVADANAIIFTVIGLLALLPIIKAIYWFTETYATEKWVAEQIRLITARIDKLDVLISRGGLNSEEAIEEFCKLRSSVDNLTALMQPESRHTPQCQVSRQTPDDPAPREWPEPKHQTRRNRTIRGDE